MKIPFYDPSLSYEENYSRGPFGDFANNSVFQNSGEAQYEFLGHKVFLPFGIPAGPLLNSAFVKAAFQKGFDIAVYKTVRSGVFPCHPFPNVLAVHPKGDLTLERAKKSLVADRDYSEPLSITNSFGVPSRTPDVWQEDVKKATSYAGKGQVMVLSFMGTVRKDQSQEEFIQDFALTARFAAETGAKVLEANLSCPNIGNEGLVCYNLPVTAKICEVIRREIGNTPLVLKVGYFEQDEDLEKLAAIAHEFANSISAINTIAAPIVDEKGEQALPGSPMRLKSGVCGASIKWAGLDTVKRLRKIRDEKGYSFKIDGVGGVVTTDDYFDYVKAGADAVMSATGAMWNAQLSEEIKTRIKGAFSAIESY